MISKSTCLPCLIAIISGFFLSSCFESDENNSDSSTVAIPEIHRLESDSLFELTKKGILFYSRAPFSGFLTVSYQDGSVKEVSSYNEGLKEGNSVGYSMAGDTVFLRPYHKGNKHGNHFGWYTNGQLKFHYIFENGLSIGNHKEWYDDGQLFQDLNYVNGYELGLQRVWRKDGKLRSNYVMRENGRKYGMLGLKRCAKIDTEAQTIDRFNVNNED